MNSKNIYFCNNYDNYNFKTKRNWRCDNKYEPFVYIIQEKKTGIKYIGSKTAKNCLESCLGTTYFTSSKKFDWKSDPDSFEILNIYKCASNHDAIILEAYLIENLNAVFNEEYFNRSKAGKSFNSSGLKRKITEKTRQRMKEAAKHRKIHKHTIKALHKSIKNSIWIHNKKLKLNKRIKISEFHSYNNWEKGRYVSDQFRKCLIQNGKNRKNKKLKPFTKEHRNNIGKTSKGKVPVIDTETGNKFKCDINDPNYISGKYIHVTKGKKLSEERKQKVRGFIVVKEIISGKVFRCKTNDPKYISGEYVPAMKGETIVCPHCGKEGGKTIMKRWHFDNCKFINQNI